MTPNEKLLDEDHATAELKAAYDAALNALDASHKIRDEQAKKIQELLSAALWLASRKPGTPVPDWVDEAVNA